MTVSFFLRLMNYCSTCHTAGSEASCVLQCTTWPSHHSICVEDTRWPRDVRYRYRYLVVNWPLPRRLPQNKDVCCVLLSSTLVISQCATTPTYTSTYIYIYLYIYTPTYRCLSLFTLCFLSSMLADVTSLPWSSEDNCTSTSSIQADTSSHWR